MTDISTSCKKFNMWPGSRILNGQYEKTVILVVGSSCAGKSTLCEKLLNDNLCFVCTDSICIRGGHQIKKILDYLDEHKGDNPINIGLMGIAISKMEEYKPFVDFFFEKYILENDFENILLEGHLMSLDNIRERFLARCKENKIRVWVMERKA